jgi:hypothetical protein
MFNFQGTPPVLSARRCPLYGDSFVNIAFGPAFVKSFSLKFPKVFFARKIWLFRVDLTTK